MHSFFFSVFFFFFFFQQIFLIDALGIDWWKFLKWKVGLSLPRYMMTSCHWNLFQVTGPGPLAHWGRDKMATISHFQIYFIEWKCLNCYKNFIEIYSQGCNWQYSSIGSDNGLAPNRRQAIIWNSDVLVCRRIYVLVGLSELTLRPLWYIYGSLGRHQSS